MVKSSLNTENYWKISNLFQDYLATNFFDILFLKLAFLSLQSNFPAFQNAIAGFTKNVDRKYEILETQASSNILPPQFDTNTLDPTLIPASEEFPRTDKTNERRNAFSGESVENSLRRMSPPPTGFEPPKLLPTYNDEFRRQEEARLKQLGLPLQTVTSQNQQQKNTVTRFNAPQPAASQFKPTVRPVTTSLQSTKKPADKTFDPDKNFKAFEHILQPGKTATHKDYDFSRYFTKKQKSDPTTAPVQRRQDFGSLNRQQVTVSTTKRNFVQQTTTPTTTTQRATTTTTVRPQTSRVTATTTKRPVTQAARIQTFNQPSAFNQIQQSNQFGRPSTIAPRQNEIVAPARDLLPPLDVLRSYDDATTRGPAVYYEWKVPESGLLPPKLENDTEAQSKRSITEEGNFDNDFHSSESRRVGHGNSIKIQYKDLQKLFAIPQFDFPIESSGRDGYENTEAVNSFQVKIPYKASDKQEGRYYYLEHAHCNPECHPYFFKPGRCEPCIKL